MAGVQELQTLLEWQEFRSSLQAERTSSSDRRKRAERGRTNRTSKRTIMIDRTECIQRLEACKNVVAEKFGVHSMRLFGSVARDEQKESSDVDICVDMEPSLLKRSGLKIYLEEVLQCPVDVLRIHNRMDQFLLKQIEHDGILIFSS